MPVISGFAALAELPWERVTDKIERRVLAGQQGMIVWWLRHGRLLSFSAEMLAG